MQSIVKRILALVVAAAIFAPSFGSQVDHIGRNQKVLIIPVKFTNFPTTRFTGTQWKNLFNTTMNPFLTKATLALTSYNFILADGPGAPADGWFDLGIDDAHWPGTTAGAVLAMQKAQAYLPNMSDVNRVLVVTNSTNFGGQTTYWQWMPVPDAYSESTQIIGSTSTKVRLMCTSAGNEWQAKAHPSSIATWDAGCVTMCHELSHQLGLPTHYSDITWDGDLHRDSISPWDIMGFSPTLNQYLGWAKNERGFVPVSSSRVQVVGPVTSGDIDTTIPLEPISNLTSGTQIIRIPLTHSGIFGEPFEGYVLEYRANTPGFETTDYDGNNLAEGVLVTLCDEHPEVPYGVKALVEYNSAFPTDATRAPLRVGDSYADAARGVSINVTAGTSGHLNVHIHLTFPPPGQPDPQIIPWGNPPYSTPDIWLDSERNGWGVYQFTSSPGHPSGQGDAAWVDHDNRVYVRVRNIGPGDAGSVRVTVYQNSPPNLGDAGPDWNVIGNILIPSLPAGAVSTNYVIWHPTPATTSHTCLRAVIEDYPGEITNSNNKAQENITFFETSPGSPYQPFSSTMNVYNPHTTVNHHIIFNVRGMPFGWTWSLTPLELNLPPGGHAPVTLKVFPPDPTVSQRKEDQVGNMPKITVEAYADFEDDYVKIGGTEHWVSLVWPTTLSLGSDGASVSGSLKQTKPAVQGVPSERIGLEFVRTGARYMLFPTTDSSGMYQLSLTSIPTPGTYTVTANFVGDRFFHSAVSAPITVNVYQYGPNVLSNGGAESGKGSVDGFTQEQIPSWTIANGFNCVVYGAQGPYPTATDPGPKPRGFNFFAGGNSQFPSSSASQGVSLTAYAKTIDSGTQHYLLDAYLGGYLSDTSTAAVYLTYYNAPHGTVLGSNSLAPVTVSDRNKLTSLLLRQRAGLVPKGTRYVLVRIVCTKGSGNFDLACADNVDLRMAK